LLWLQLSWRSGMPGALPLLARSRRPAAAAAAAAQAALVGVSPRVGDGVAPGTWPIRCLAPLGPWGQLGWLVKTLGPPLLPATLLAGLLQGG
jgi:hypothetical protein